MGPNQMPAPGSGIREAWSPRVPAQAPALTLRGDVVGRRLSPREVEVLARLANGHSRKAIARHLAIADSTFRATVAHIYRKLGVSSELGAALAMGYVTPPSLVEMAGNYALTETWTASA